MENEPLNRVESLKQAILREKSLRGNFIESNQIFQIIMMFQDEYLKSTKNIQQLVEDAYENLRSVNQNAGQVVELVDTSSKTIRNNIETSRNSIQTMSTAADSVKKLDTGFNNLMGVFDQLNDSIKMIVDKINAIVDISELTNLLALNAAIEAARAGEQGRGFQVVAKEIRKLADRSRSSTNDISDVLKVLKVKLQDANEFLSQYGLVQDEVLGNISSTSHQLSKSAEELQKIDLEIGSINHLVGDQADNTESLLQSLDTVYKTGEFTMNKQPFIESAVNSYKSVNQQNGKDLSALGDVLTASNTNLVSDKYSEDEKTLAVGHDIAYPPWTYIKEGIPEGISVDYAKKVLSRLGYRPDFVGGQWADLYSRLVAGELDLLVNVGWPNDFFRNEPVIVSKPYEKFKIRLFSANQEASELDVYRGKNVAVQRGSFAEDITQKVKCNPVPFENDIQGMTQLLWKNVDAVATEERVGEFISRSLFLDQIKSTSEVVSSLDVVYMFRNDSIALRDSFNEAITSLNRDVSLENY